MPRVVGLDLSLTCTGVGVITLRQGRPCIASASTVTSKGTRAASLVDRHARITTLGNDIVHHAKGAELAVIEAPFASGTKGGSPIDRMALFWFVAGALIRREVPVASIVGSSLKLAITGKGNCDKAALAVAITRLWPDVDVTSSDVSDAVGLAHLGAVYLDWPVETLERHRAVKAEWPHTPDPRAKGQAVA